MKQTYALVTDGKTIRKRVLQLATLVMAHGLAASARAQSTNPPPATSGNDTPPAPASGENVTAPPTTGGATPPPTQLPDVVVTGNATPDSYKTDAVDLPKLTQPLLDTPQSVTVIPQQVIQDQNATTLRDVLRNVAGISIAAGEGNTQGDNLTLRGFTAQNDIYLDGMRNFGNYYRDPFDYEEVDVLEGPESVMFGRGSTGGVINQESKMPELDPFVAGTLTGGTDLTRRATIDVDELVPDLGPGAAFRLNAMGDESGIAGFDVAENRRFGLAPSLTLGIGTPTRLTVSYLHQQEDDLPDYGLPWFFNSPADVPRGNFYGFQDDYLRTDVNIGTIKLEHDVGDSLTLDNQVRYGDYGRDWRITEPQLAAGTTPSTPLSSVLVNRNELGGFSTETSLWDQFAATKKFTTGFIDHTLVAGVEGGRETSDPTRYAYTGVPGTTLLSPNEDQDFSGTATIKSQVTTTALSAGVYALDTMKLGEHWELSGGVRWDYFNANYEQSVPPASAFNQAVEMPSYRGALIYKPVPIGSIYFDYGTSWDPSAETLALSAADANTPPEKNETFELGTKWDLLSKKLSVRASVFRTEKTNAREPDPNDPTEDVLGGDEQVDGLELAVTGHLTKEWQVMASYDRLDSKVVSSQDYPASVGYPLANVPKNSASIWTTYQLPWNLEIGGGLDYVGSRDASSTAPLNGTTGLLVEAPGYWTLNAMLKYKVSDHVDIQLNINNLTNNYYYDQLHPGHVIPGAAISAMLSTSFKY